jgi:hypothetical protein
LSPLTGSEGELIKILNKFLSKLTGNFTNYRKFSKIHDHGIV